MPELPDIAAYLTALESRVMGKKIERVKLGSPFLLRTIDPPLSGVEDRAVRELRRVGKRIAFGMEGDSWLVLHLMIAGRLHWKPRSAKAGPKGNLAVIEFCDGALTLTEAGSKRRASLHVVGGEDGLRELDAGGIDPMTASASDFGAALARENHTLKRALTDPRILSGIGNAYSDEILHRARLSPLIQTHKLSDKQWERLYRATQETLAEWIARLGDEARQAFPEKVTAFRPEMAVHGKFGKPCPDCGEPVQRIRYADNETNYCAKCQTEGRVLADRSLSRLLGSDWPRTLEELELLRSQ